MSTPGFRQADTSVADGRTGRCRRIGASAWLSVNRWGQMCVAPPRDPIGTAEDGTDLMCTCARRCAIAMEFHRGSARSWPVVQIAL